MNSNNQGGSKSKDTSTEILNNNNNNTTAETGSSGASPSKPSGKNDQNQMPLERQKSANSISDVAVKIEAAVRLKKVHLNRSSTKELDSQFIETLKEIATKKKWLLEDLDNNIGLEIIKFLQKRLKHRHQTNPRKCHCVYRKAKIVRYNKENKTYVVQYIDSLDTRKKVIQEKDIEEGNSREYLEGEVVNIKKPDICPVQLRHYLKQLKLQPGWSPIHFICSHALVGSINIIMKIINDEDESSFSQLLELEDLHGKTPLFFAVHGLDFSLSEDEQDHGQERSQERMEQKECIARMKLVKLLMEHNARLTHRDQYGKTIYYYLSGKPDVYSYLLFKTLSAISNRISRHAVIRTRTESYGLMYKNFCDMFRVTDLKRRNTLRSINKENRKYLCKEYKLVNEWSKRLKPAMGTNSNKSNFWNECLADMRKMSSLESKIDMLSKVLVKRLNFAHKDHVEKYFKKFKGILKTYVRTLDVQISDDEILKAISNEKFLRIYYVIKPGKKFEHGKIVENNNSDRLDISFEYDIFTSNFMADDFIRDEVTLFEEDGEEMKIIFTEIENSIADIFARTAFKHENYPSNEISTNARMSKIKDKNDINQSKGRKSFNLDDLNDTLEKVCNWMISMANISIPKETLEASKYKHFKEEILREIQNILIDVILYSNLISLDMDLSQKESILKEFLDKAYDIYNDRSKLYSWEKIEFKLAIARNGTTSKEMYVVRLYVVDKSKGKYDTKRRQRHLVHETFKYPVVIHHVKNLFYKFVDKSLHELCTKSQVKITNRDFMDVKQRRLGRQRVHSRRIMKHFGTSMELLPSEISRNPSEVRSVSLTNEEDLSDAFATKDDDDDDLGDTDEMNFDYVKPRWRVVCREKLENVRKERDEHHMWMDNIKFRDSILKAQETIQKKFQEEQRLDKKLVKWRRRLVETVNQFITDVVDPALSSGLGHILCRATCRPDLLTEYDKARFGADGFINDSDAEKMLQKVFSKKIYNSNYRSIYRVGRNDLINILEAAPVVKQWKIVFYPKILKILNALLVQACKFDQGPHEVARSIVKKLLRKGADPNSTDANGNTALFLASNYHPIHKTDICSLLIKAGGAVNVSILSNFIDNLSRVSGQMDRKEKNEKKSNDIKNHLKYVVFYGAYYGTLTENVLAYMNSISLTDRYGNISHNLLSDIQSVPDERNFLPMHYAAMHGNVEVIDLLYCYGGKDCINKQFDVNITKMVNGKKVFQVFHSKPTSIAKLLEESNQVKTAYGFTPLALAVQNNHPNAVQKLLSLGAKPFPFDNETDFQTAKDNYLCPYWLALGLFRATEDPASRYDPSVNTLNKTLVILKHPKDTPTTHFQKVIAEVKLMDINKQVLRRKMEELHGDSIEDDATENIDAEALYSITEALTKQADKNRRNSNVDSPSRVSTRKRNKSVLVKAIKHDFVHSSTDQEMRDKQLQMLVVKKIRSNYIERRGKDCEKWRDTPLFTFGDNLKALKVDNKAKDRLIEFMDTDLNETTTKLNSSNLDIIEKEKRKEILNIMNSHYKVKSMLYKYGARQFAWPCFVYILLLVFCIYTVPSFFWESDYAFEVNSLIITQLRKDLIPLKDEDTGVFGAPRGFLNIGKLGPWISESMLKTHLPYLHENGKLQQIGNIKICSLLSRGWKVWNDKSDVTRRSYNERDWDIHEGFSNAKNITLSDVNDVNGTDTDVCKPILQKGEFQEYCFEIWNGTSQDLQLVDRLLGSNTTQSLCPEFKKYILRTRIYLHFYSKQANLLSQIQQVFSVEPTGIITSQFKAESIKEETWDFGYGITVVVHFIMECIFCVYLIGELIGMIKALVVAGKYTEMLIRQKYKIAGRAALLHTYEEERKFHDRGDLPVKTPTCCNIIPIPCKLSQRVYSVYWIRNGVNINVLKSIVSSPNEDYESLTLSQSIIVVSGLLLVIFYVFLASMKGALQFMDGNFERVNVKAVQDIFQIAGIVRTLTTILLYTLWFRLFDVLKQDPRLGPFVRAIFKTIVSFEVIMFFVLFLLGVVPAMLSMHLFLGGRVKHLSTIYKTFRTMLMFGIVGEHEQPDFWMHGPLPDSHFVLLALFLILVVLVLMNLLIAIVTDVWQAYDRQKIYIKAVNDEIREAVSNHVEGIDYGKTSTKIIRKVESWQKLNKSESGSFLMRK